MYMRKAAATAYIPLSAGVTPEPHTSGHVTSGSHVGHAQWYILYYYYSKKKNRGGKSGHAQNILP